MPGCQRDPKTPLLWCDCTHSYLLCSETQMYFVFCECHLDASLCEFTVPFLSFFITCSWMLCQKISSRKSKKRSISSTWAQTIQRPSSRPRNTPSTFGKHSLSPDWVRSLPIIGFTLKRDDPTPTERN